METLNNYIVERIRIDNIKPNGFPPIDGTEDEIVDFLENKGFEGIKFLPRYKTLNQITTAANEEHKMIYMVGSGNPNVYSCIRFANTTYNTINPKNPMYIRTIEKDNNKIMYFKVTDGYSSMRLTGDEFENELENYFKEL